MNKLEIYQDKAGEWRWRRTANNGNIVGASAEGYKNKADAEANANRKSTPTDKWEFYKDNAGEWRWRCTSQNGNVVGKSSEGYSSKASCESNAKLNGWNG